MSTRPLVSIVVACLAAAVSILILPGRPAASWRESFSPHLLEPSGAAAVGVRYTRLDTEVDDPWNPGHPRIVMVDIRYPATAGEHPLRHYGRSQYMTEQAMLAWAPGHEEHLGLHKGEVNWLFTTHSHRWAPPRRGSFPVIVLSAPQEGMRTSYTTLAEDLAGHGFVVVTVDHPYDAPAVELWPTREVIEPDDAKRALTGQAADAVRAEDVAAVTDRLPSLDGEIKEVIAPGCAVVFSGELPDRLGDLTDDPMIEAQISARYPKTAKALGPIPSLARAERDFRVRSAQLRDALGDRLANDPRCKETESVG